MFARLHTWECWIAPGAFPIFQPAIDPRRLRFFELSLLGSRRFQVLDAPPLREFPRTQIVQRSVASSEAIHFLERNAECALLSRGGAAHGHFRHLLPLLHLSFLLKHGTPQKVAAAENLRPECAYEFCCCHILMMMIPSEIELFRCRSNRAWLVGPLEVELFRPVRLNVGFLVCA